VRSHYCFCISVYIFNRILVSIGENNKWRYKQNSKCVTTKEKLRSFWHWCLPAKEIIRLKTKDVFRRCSLFMWFFSTSAEPMREFKPKYGENVITKETQNSSPPMPMLTCRKKSEFRDEYRFVSWLSLSLCFFNHFKEFLVFIRENSYCGKKHTERECNNERKVSTLGHPCLYKIKTIKLQMESFALYLRP
jgi:hypothetical protein